MPNIIEWLKLPSGRVWHVRFSDYGLERTLCGRTIPESKQVSWWPRFSRGEPLGQHCKVCVAVKAADEKVRVKFAREKKQS